MIPHIEWRKGHSTTITAYVWTINLSRWSTIILELDGLVGHIARCSRHGVRSIVGFSLFSTNWPSYCENTDNETVVEVVSISLSISVTDKTWLAALVITSRVKGSPAVCIVKTESESTIPPDVAEV